MDGRQDVDTWLLPGESVLRRGGRRRNGKWGSRVAVWVQGKLVEWRSRAGEWEVSVEVRVKRG